MVGVGKDPLMHTPLGLHHIPVVKNKVLLNKHKKRKNNEVVVAMYAMYQTGKSLNQIGEVYHKTRQAVYDLFYSRGYKLRSKQYKGLVVLDGINFTNMKSGYLRGTINGRRMMMHHYVWEKVYGPLPKGYVVHHIDGDVKNNAISNLEIVAMVDMANRFNPKHRNQFSK